MKRYRAQPINVEVIALWRRRFAILGQRLIDGPAAQNAWFWRIQYDIINYLLHRYAGDPRLPPPIAREPIAVEKLPNAPGPVSLEFTPSGSFAASIESGKMPRASGQIRPILQSIVEINRERHEMFRRLHDEMEQASRLERLRNQQAIALMRKWLAAEGRLDEFDDVEPLPAVLTGNQIVQILSEMIDLDSPELPSCGADTGPDQPASS